MIEKWIPRKWRRGLRFTVKLHPRQCCYQRPWPSPCKNSSYDYEFIFRLVDLFISYRPTVVANANTDAVSQHYCVENYLTTIVANAAVLLHLQQRSTFGPPLSLWSLNQDLITVSHSLQAPISTSVRKLQISEDHLTKQEISVGMTKKYGF